MIKKILPALITITLFFIVPIKAKELTNSILAVIGKNVITQMDFSEQLSLYLQQIPEDQRNNIDIDNLKKELLREMVNRKIMEEFAKKEGYEIDKDKVNQQIEATIDNIRRNFKNDKEFNLYLIRNGIDLQDLKKKYKEQIEENMYVQQVIDKEIRKNIVIKDSEIEQFFKEHKEEFKNMGDKYDLAQILIRVKPSDNERKRVAERLEAIRNEIKNGKDFSEAAKEYSEDVTAVKGGDLGYFGKGEMIPEFENAAFSLKINEVSKVVETQYGMHIIKLLEKRGEKIRASHILLKMNLTAEDTLNTKKIINELYEKIQKGAEFGELAKEYSDDIATKNKNGNMGSFTQYNLNPSIYEQIKDLKKGEYKVVESEIGFHIIKVIDRKGIEDLQISDISSQIKNVLSQKKLGEATEKWVAEKEKSEIYVKIFWERL